jgi:hypothetical protein
MYLFACLYLLTTGTSFENCLFNSFAYLFTELIFWEVVYLFVFSSMYILVINLLLLSSWKRFFSYSVDCLFILVTISFSEEKIFSLMQSHLSVLPLNCWATGVLFRKLLSMFVFSLLFSVVHNFRFYVKIFDPQIDTSIGLGTVI